MLVLVAVVKDLKLLIRPALDLTELMALKRRGIASKVLLVFSRNARIIAKAAVANIAVDVLLVGIQGSWSLM